MRHNRGSRLVPLLVLLALCSWNPVARAEASSVGEPIVGLHLQPNLSLVLPFTSAEAVIDVYGVAHATGSVGFTLEATRRFQFEAALEIYGWAGELPGIGSSDEHDIPVPAYPLHFLNEWIHINGRITVLRHGIFRLLADIRTGLIFGREDGERFRAEGRGVSLGAGIVSWLALTPYFAMSVDVALENGWIWYEVQSPQGQDTDYLLLWPRVLVGLSFHAMIVHRRPAPSRATREVSEPEEQQEQQEQQQEQQEQEQQEQADSSTSTPL